MPVKPELAKHEHKSTTHEERFVHFPCMDDHIPGCSTGNFNYPKAASAFCREEEPNSWFAAFSFCVWEDQFSRKIGRQVARRRYFEGNRIPIGIKFDYEIVRKLMIEKATNIANGFVPRG